MRYSHVIKGREVSHLCHACHDNDDPISESSSSSTCTLLAPRITEHAPMRIPRVLTCLPKLHELRIATWQPEGLKTMKPKSQRVHYLKVLAMGCVPPTTLECHALELPWPWPKSHGSLQANLSQTSFISATSIQKMQIPFSTTFFPKSNALVHIHKLLLQIPMADLITMVPHGKCSPSGPPTAEAHGFEGHEN